MKIMISNIQHGYPVVFGTRSSIGGTLDRGDSGFEKIVRRSDSCTSRRMGSIFFLRDLDKVVSSK